MNKICLLLVFIGACACQSKQTGSPAPASDTAAPIEPVAAPKPAAAPKKQSVGDKLHAATEITDAIKILKPMFVDTNDEVNAPGAALALWIASSSAPVWEQIQALPETKQALVMKDPDLERGKKLCATGEITEIQADRSAGKAIYVGGLMTANQDIVRFIAAGSTGELVEESAGKICGVVTGLDHYSNSGGGTTHAVAIVGLFDLPENKKAAAIAQ